MKIINKIKNFIKNTRIKLSTTLIARIKLSATLIARSAHIKNYLWEKEIHMHLRMNLLRYDILQKAEKNALFKMLIVYVYGFFWVLYFTVFLFRPLVMIYDPVIMPEEIMRNKLQEMLKLAIIDLGGDIPDEQPQRVRAKSPLNMPMYRKPEYPACPDLPKVDFSDPRFDNWWEGSDFMTMVGRGSKENWPIDDPRWYPSERQQAILDWLKRCNDHRVIRETKNIYICDLSPTAQNIVTETLNRPEAERKSFFRDAWNQYLRGSNQYGNPPDDPQTYGWLRDGWVLSASQRQAIDTMYGYTPEFKMKTKEAALAKLHDSALPLLNVEESIMEVQFGIDYILQNYQSYVKSHDLTDLKKTIIASFTFHTTDGQEQKFKIMQIITRNALQSEVYTKEEIATVLACFDIRRTELISSSGHYNVPIDPEHFESLKMKYLGYLEGVTTQQNYIFPKLDVLHWETFKENNPSITLANFKDINYPDEVINQLHGYYDAMINNKGVIPYFSRGTIKYHVMDTQGVKIALSTLAQDNNMLRNPAEIVEIVRPTLPPQQIIHGTRMSVLHPLNIYCRNVDFSPNDIPLEVIRTYKAAAYTIQVSHDNNLTPESLNYKRAVDLLFIEQNFLAHLEQINMPRAKFDSIINVVLNTDDEKEILKAVQELIPESRWKDTGYFLNVKTVINNYLMIHNVKKELPIRIEAAFLTKLHFGSMETRGISAEIKYFSQVWGALTAR